MSDTQGAAKKIAEGLLAGIGAAIAASAAKERGAESEVEDAVAITEGALKLLAAGIAEALEMLHPYEPNA